MERQITTVLSYLAHGVLYISQEPKKKKKKDMYA